ncbi:MAG: hypothetical protein WCC21_03060 [Candidatus Acidiferrales bacterium]
MQIVVNNFAADLTPVEPSLPFLDYGSWDESTEAKESAFGDFQTWRYEMDDAEAGTSAKPVRMVFLSGPALPDDTPRKPFDIGRFWRIGNLLTEHALASHFTDRGFTVERNQFESVALRPYLSSPDDAIELATGISFLAQRPFRDDTYRFAVAFRWVVQAHFKETLANKALAGIAVGMSVLYRPAGAAPHDLKSFRNRFIGRVRNIENDGTATILCKDDQHRVIPLRDLRLEASPPVIKLYEKRVRGRTGTSSVIRAIQKLNMSLTNDNRRSVTVLKDRLEAIRRLLKESGSSAEQLIIPLRSFDSGSLALSIAPMEADMGGAL